MWLGVKPTSTNKDWKIILLIIGIYKIGKTLETHNPNTPKWIPLALKESSFKTHLEWA